MRAAPTCVLTGRAAGPRPPPCRLTPAALPPRALHHCAASFISRPLPSCPSSRSRFRLCSHHRGLSASAHSALRDHHALRPVSGCRPPSRNLPVGARPRSGTWGLSAPSGLTDPLSGSSGRSAASLGAAECPVGGTLCTTPCPWPPSCTPGPRLPGEHRGRSLGF